MKAYKATLIHPEIPSGRAVGQLLVYSGEIRFQSEEKNLSLKFSDINLNAGGSGNCFLFFASVSNPEISVYTDDKSILKDYNIISYTKFTTAIVSAKRKLNSVMKGSLALIGVFLLLVGGVYLLKDKLVEKIAKQVPVEWENAAGEKLFSTLSLQFRFIKNDSLHDEFIAIAKPLFEQIEKQGYKIDLYFIKDPGINAFALPGGKIVVQSGLIENAKNWEEVMGVLAHELAHVTRRHHVRGIINNMGIFLILSAAIGDVSAIAGTFANMGGELASLSNSRTFEREADETGWNYLIKAKMNPKGLADFFETLSKQSTLDSMVQNRVDLSFLSTHPKTEERIKTLRKKQSKLKSTFVPLPNTYEEFKKKFATQK